MQKFPRVGWKGGLAAILSVPLTLLAFSLFASCNMEPAPGKATAPDEDLAVAAATMETGLDFPSNGQTEADVRFLFRGTALQPMYPATYVWRVKARRHTGYYTLFYWGPNGTFTGGTYYGPRPYPDGDTPWTSTDHKWGLSLNGQDVVTDSGGKPTQLGYDVWKVQALRVYDNGFEKVHEYYYDLPDTTKVIAVNLHKDYHLPRPTNAALSFGDAPWAIGQERLSGVLRGLQLYNAKLSLSNLLGEINAPLSTPSAPNIWYLNLNPTPSDITDKSGKAHHPTWASSARPALWTGDSTAPPPVPTVSLAANPTSVNSGGSSTLTWSSTDATSCNASGAWSGAKAVSGSQSTGALTATSTFTLTCTGAGGSASASATVTVASTPPPAPTVSLAANPTSVNSGGSSTLTWSSTDATSCNASGAWSGAKAVSGSQSTGALAATSTFTLTCTGAGGSASRSATVTVTSGGAITGLDFPSNGQTSTDIRFRFTGAARPPMYPATYIWRVKVRRQSGYYTTFFWGPEQLIGTNYYGAHPYPDNGLETGTTHKWEVSLDGKDFTNDAHGHSTQLGYDVWRLQAFRAFDNGVEKIHEFYWDLPDTTKVIRVALDRSYGTYPGPTPVLTFGDAPWSIGNERLSGILRGIQLYNAKLTLGNVISESGTPLSTPAGSAGIWYLNVNPVPGDITDKSGRGHHPAWVGSGRASLWTGP